MTRLSIWFNDKSIQTKLVISNLLVISAALLLGVTITFLYEYYALKQATLQEIRVQAEIVSDNAAAAMAFGDRVMAYEALATLKASPDMQRASLTQTNGEILASYPSEELPSRNKSCMSTHIAAEELAWNKFQLCKPVYLKTEFVGTLTLDVGLGTFYRRVILYSFAVLLATGISLIGAIWLALRLSKSITEPLSRLLSVVNHVADKQDFSVRPEVERTDEIGVLSRAFHGMMSKLKERDDRLSHAREQEFRAMVENSPDTIARYDKQCRCIYINPAMQKLIGLSLEKIYGKKPTEISPFSEEFMQVLMRVLESGKDFQAELPFHNTLSDIRWCDWRLAPEFDSSGMVISVLAIGRDISQRKQMEETLATSERGFRALAENLPDNILRYDRDERIVYLNQKLAKSFGQDAASLIGKNAKELTPSAPFDKSVAEYFETLDEVLATGVPGEIEMHILDANGNTMIHHVRFVAEKHADGEIYGVLTIGRDVTELKQMEKENHLIAQLYRFNSEAMLMFDMAGNITSINPSCINLTGYTPENISGMNLNVLIADNNAPLNVSQEENIPELWQGDILLRKINGEVFTAWLTLNTIYDEEGVAYQRFVQFSDVSEIRKVQLQAQELLQQNRLLTKDMLNSLEDERRYLSRELHDELGQWLTAIQAEAGAISSNRTLAGKDQIKVSAKSISDSAAQIQLCIRGILRRLRPSLLDALGLEDSLREMIMHWNKHHEDMVCQLCIEGNISGLGEEINITLYRVIQEALNNAAKYSQSSNLRVKLLHAQDELFLSIEDDGVGINLQAQTKGLGLMGMRERIVARNGNFDLHSQPGHGVRIEIKLPLV